MNVIEAIYKRRAIKHFDPEHKLTADEERARRVIAALEFGHVGHNTGSGPTPEAPSSF